MTTLLISNVFPPTPGGSGRWFWELYRRLPSDKYFLSVGDCSGAVDFDRSHQLQLERLPLKFGSWGMLGVRPAWTYLTAWRSIRRTVLRNRIQTVHAGCALPEGWLAWLLKRRFGLPYAVYVHGEELEVFHSSRELAWMAKRVYRNADLLIANSENTAELLRAKWTPSDCNLKVMHPGVDTDYFCPSPRDPALREKLGWGERPVILTVGRLQKRKGHDVLIQALSAIRAQVPELLYAVIGDGEERAALETLVNRFALRDHVLFHGVCDDATIRSAYRQCDVFVLPNREVEGDFEGFGIVLLEAQACGKPVVTGDSGGTVEAIQANSTGWILDCRSTSPLEQLLPRILLDEQLRIDVGSRARSWTLSHFQWPQQAAVAQGYFDELEPVCAHSPQAAKHGEPLSADAAVGKH